MRILITDFFGIMAGSSYSALYLAEGLVEKGHEVWVAHKEGSFLGKLTKESAVCGLPFQSAGKFNLRVARQVSDFVKENKIDIINAQASPDRYVTIFARWFFGMPGKLIHTRRQKPETTGGKFKAWFYTRGTDKIIAVSPAVKKYLTESGIPENHIEVVPNGIPESKWKNIDPINVNALKEKYDIKKDDIVIGCVSRIKKQDQILKAVALINRPVKVIFVGIEDEYSHLTDIIETLPTMHQVFFTGEISNKEALHYYPLFTMKILPSDMEGLSQSLLEAMLLGIPVIATRASGNPDLIEDGVNGLLFIDQDVDQLYNLINQLLISFRLRDNIVRKAEEMVKQEYLMSEIVCQYDKLFTDFKSLSSQQIN